MPSDLFSKLIFAICKLLAGPCSCMQPPVSPITPFLWACCIAPSFWALPVPFGSGWCSCLAVSEWCPNMGRKMSKVYWHEYDLHPTKKQSFAFEFPGTHEFLQINSPILVDIQQHTQRPTEQNGMGHHSFKEKHQRKHPSETIWSCFISRDPHHDIYFDIPPSHILPDINSEIHIRLYIWSFTYMLWIFWIFKHSNA